MKRSNVLITQQREEVEMERCNVLHITHRAEEKREGDMERSNYNVLITHTKKE